MGRVLFISILLLNFTHSIICPAIGTHDKHEASSTQHSAEHKGEGDTDELGLEYGRYLQQVVSALEEDKDFSAKLENASMDSIKSGQIADQLHFVDHKVRSRLDELKRIEMERLHSLTKKEKLLKEKVERDHLDHGNPTSFEVEDLHRLILAATRDLEKLDEKRREEFKEYEMKKELEFRSQLAHTNNDTERQEMIKKHDEQLSKHRDHPRVHHPGSKAQLEQVWQENDHLPVNEFDPKTFFSLHDLNADGYLDTQEVEALLTLEVRKLYDPAHNPNGEDDPREMMEEFHRMREHIYREADKDKDGLISRKEFLDLTSRPDFESSDREGWQEIDPAARPPYTEQELADYYKNQYYHYQVDPNHHQVDPNHHQVDPNHHQMGQPAPPPPANYYYQHPQTGQYVAYQVPQYQGHPQAGVQGYQQQQHPGAPQQAHPQQAVQYQQVPHGQMAPVHSGQPVQYQVHPGQAQVNQYQGNHGQTFQNAPPPPAQAYHAPPPPPGPGHQQQHLPQSQQHPNVPVAQGGYAVPSNNIPVAGNGSPGHPQQHQQQQQANQLSPGMENAPTASPPKH